MLQLFVPLVTFILVRLVLFLDFTHVAVHPFNTFVQLLERAALLTLIEHEAEPVIVEVVLAELELFVGRPVVRRGE